MTQYKALSLVVVAFLAGCATVTQTSTMRTPLPREPVAQTIDPTPQAIIAEIEPEPEIDEDDSVGPTEPVGDPFAKAPVAVPSLTVAISDSHTYYHVGREAFRFGDMDTARDYFERSVDTLCQSVDDGNTDLEPLLDSVTSYVAAYELAWAEWDGADGDSEVDPSNEAGPLDVLSEVDLPDVASPTRPAEQVPSNVLAHDVPLVINNQVLAMLDIYTGRLRDQIEPAFIRSGRYLPMMRQIFAEEGVPQDLVWLSLVESAFKPTAYSRAAAKGLWQFIYSTGKLYGLNRTYWIDDRSDPFKATRAAARHLRDLYQDFGDWYLVLAAYNAGPGKVNRAIRHVGKTDYWALASSRHLRAETKNYVPAFLATLLIAQDREKYGFTATPESPWAFDRVTVDGPADLTVIADLSGSTLDELKLHNPELRHRMTPGDRTSYELRVPQGRGEKLQLAYADLPAAQRLRSVTHTVGSGETLARISRQYGVRVESIAAANGLQSRQRMAVGTALLIPLTPGAFSTQDDEFERPRRTASKAGDYHRVRRGETLSRIAGRYGVSLSQLRSWNGLRSDRIQSGTSLRVSSASRQASHSRSRRVKDSASDTRTVRHHRVKSGETMWAIAQRYGVGVQDLLRWNGKPRASDLRAGQKLKIYN